MRRKKPFFILMTLSVMLFGMSCSNQGKETSTATDSAVGGEDIEIVTMSESDEEAPVADYDGAPNEEYAAPTYNATAQPADDNVVHSLDEYDGN